MVMYDERNIVITLFPLPFPVNLLCDLCSFRLVASFKIKMAGERGKFDVVVVGSCMTDLVRLA